MKVICDSIGSCPHCIDCGAARVHDKMGCEACPSVPTAKCIEVQPIQDFDDPTFFALITALKFMQELVSLRRPDLHIGFLEYFQNKTATQEKGLYRVEYRKEGGNVEVKLYTIKTPQS